MRSDRAKVLFPIAGRPLVDWVRRAAAPAVDRTVVVVGHRREDVARALEGTDVRVAVQEPQLGTAHALAVAVPELGDAESLVVLLGDAPFVAPRTVEQLLRQREDRGDAAVVLTFSARDPTGYGRILRDASGGVRAIVEEREAGPAERAVCEVSSGAMALDAAKVLPLLPDLPRHANSERYLTDAIGRLVAARLAVSAFETDEREALGINSPEQLARAEEAAQRERAGRLAADGVTVDEPSSLELHADVEVARGTRLRRGVRLLGRTRVGAECDLGPSVVLRDVELGEGCRVVGPLELQGERLAPGTRRCP